MRQRLFVACDETRVIVCAKKYHSFYKAFEDERAAVQEARKGTPLWHPVAANKYLVPVHYLVIKTLLFIIA